EESSRAHEILRHRRDDETKERQRRGDPLKLRRKRGEEHQQHPGDTEDQLRKHGVDPAGLDQRVEGHGRPSPGLRPPSPRFAGRGTLARAPLPLAGEGAAKRRVRAASATIVLPLSPPFCTVISSCCTLGDILRRNTLGYRPIQTISTTSGTIAATSFQAMSGMKRFSSLVIGPKKTRWTSQRR